MLSRLILTLISIISVSCAYAQNFVNVEVSIKKLYQKKWQVEYQFDRPISEAYFSRNTNRFREENWKIITPGIVIDEFDSQERFVSSNGMFFDQVVIELDSYYDSLVKEYNFFLAFTDGSELMYTGHFELYKADSKKAQVKKYTFQSVGETISFEGQKYQGQANWIPPKDNNGIYVYFGEINPIESEYMMAYLDPGLPNWLKKLYTKFIPELFEGYTQTIGYKLRSKPLIYFNHDPSGSGQGSGGGVLSGSVQISTFGQGWEVETADLRERALFVLAHESAHLWNSVLFMSQDTKASYWLHEGGANTFAYRMLYKLNLITEERLYENYTEQLNLCLRDLDFPLNESAARGKFKAYYRCGSTIGLITEKIIEKYSLSIFDFWIRLFQESIAKGYYNQKDYFRILNDIAGDFRVSLKLKQLVDYGFKSYPDFFYQYMISLGINITKAQDDFIIKP